MRGLRSKLQSFYKNVSECFFDVIIITETWLNDSFLNSELCPPFYNVIRNDRKCSIIDRIIGGGVLILFSKTVTYSVVDTTSIAELVPAIDLIVCNCFCNTFQFYLAAVYIPPNISCSEFESFFEALETLLLNKPTLFIGDFNLANFNNNLTYNTPGSKNHVFSTFSSSLNFIQHNCIFNTHNRLLDLILSNFDGSVNVSHENYPIVPEDIHHPSLSMIVKFPTSAKVSNFPSGNNLRYNFRKANYVNLYNDILVTDWSSLSFTNDVNACVNLFYDKLYSILHSSVPQFHVVKSTYPSWFNKNLISTLKLKDYYRTKWNKTSSEFYHSEFKRLRAICKQLINSAYQAYLSSIEQSLYTCPQNMWKYAQAKKGTTRIPGKLSHNGNEYDHPQQIVDIFAENFSSMYKSKLDVSLTDVVTNNSSFIMQNVSEEEVLSVMSSFPNKLTAGDDLIPSFIIRDTRFALARPLTTIFNLAIKSSTFPDTWKIARITPVYKKGDASMIKNYRPISILSNFAKIFEILIYRNIYHNVKSLISIHQHGFLPGRSTITNLAIISQFISQQIDKNGQVDVVYTDFSCAFDSIDHHVLLCKLSWFGFAYSFLKLMESYLDSRQNYVFYNGFQSKNFVSTSGVPQGSNLGPLLFVVFVNDLLDSLRCKVLAYADDIKLYSSIRCLDDSILLQNNLERMVDWCKEFKLLLNTDKCFIMTYTKKLNPVCFSYLINDKSIKKIQLVKDLGITFDSHLSFTQHMHNICLSSSKMLGFTFRLTKDFTDPQLMKMLYFSFVRSKLEYGSIIWYPYYESHRLAIEKVQRRFLKCLSFRIDGIYPIRGMEYNLLLARHQIHSLSSRRQLYSANFLWNLIQGKIDCPILLANVNFHVPRIVSRHASSFLPSIPRTNQLRKAPLEHMYQNVKKFYDDVFYSKMNQQR